MKAYYIILSALLFSCKGNRPKNLPDICFDGNFNQPVNEISLNNNYEIKKLNGKFIKVDGILHYSFEDVALYPSSKSDASNAFWLDLRLPKEVSDTQLEKLNKRKVTIIGKVNIANKGHLGAYLATLDSAFCIKIR